MGAQHQLHPLAYPVHFPSDSCQETIRSRQRSCTEIESKRCAHQESCTSATLNVVDGTLTWTGTESLSMLSPNSDDVATGTFTPSIAENGGDKIGYLMAKPTDGTAALELEVTIEAPDAATSVPTEQTVTLQVNTPGGFKKGIIYNVQIGVYSMQEVWWTPP